MNAQLEQFVRDALGRGLPRDQIRDALAKARWRPEEIDGALGRWADVEFPVPVPRRDTQLSAREAFLYLLLFATLYVAAYHTGAILFLMVERWFPDALAPGGWGVGSEAMRWAVASLVIALPVFLYTNRVIGAALARDPEKRSSGVRRWLTYLTLFFAALVLIGDFVVVLRGLLAGELATRFLLKSAVVAAIAGIVFRHYLGDLRRDETEAPAARTRLGLGHAGVIAMVVVAVAGLVVLGTPGRARLSGLDHKRVQDLRQLANAVASYRAQTQHLPTVLAELSAVSGIGRAEMRDPQTGALYEYAVVDSTRFMLCATFAAPDSLGPWSNQPSDFWRHGAGRHCFTFTANPGGFTVPGD